MFEKTCLLDLCLSLSVFIFIVVDPLSVKVYHIKNYFRYQTFSRARKRIFILWEWPAMESIAGEAEKNLSVDAYMSPPILIFDVLTCYGGVMNPLCCPVCF